MKTPQALLNAVFYVEEMLTPFAADSLLSAAQQAGMPFNEVGKHSLADVVMQVWLFDSKIVETQHAWHTWKTPRRMECYQAVQPLAIAPIAITNERSTGPWRAMGHGDRPWDAMGTPTNGIYRDLAGHGDTHKQRMGHGDTHKRALGTPTNRDGSLGDTDKQNLPKLSGILEASELVAENLNGITGQEYIIC